MFCSGLNDQLSSSQVTQTAAALLSQLSLAEPEDVLTFQELFTVSCRDFFLKNVLT